MLVSNKISSGEKSYKYFTGCLYNDHKVKPLHIILPITKIKSQGDEVTDFNDKEIDKVDCNHTYLAVINLDSTLNKDGNYYPQVFLK